jgi:transcriptional regulator with GAF, ATPase, and Fis domain
MAEKRNVVSCAKMKSFRETAEESQRIPALMAGAAPGLLVIWSRDEPAAEVLELTDGRIVLGRGLSVFRDDDRVSREHCRVEYDGGAWTICDLDSRNGTFLNGARLEGKKTVFESPLLRIGRTLIRVLDDVRLHREGVQVRSDGIVFGGLSKRAWAEVELAARAGTTLCLRGESGSGKELAARAFHDASFRDGRAGAFIGVNCAAIPEGLSERLLFGARKGAYSGATSDVQGYIQAASGGTLFLDEIAELDLRVQAKLLRVLETQEVLPLGATRPERVELRICAAAHADLREEVQAGRFREDLYYRVGRPEVDVAPLRQRVDELPWILQGEIARTAARLTASAHFIEACALRPWPGNVRELLGEARRAAHRALRAQRSSVDPDDLDAEAGHPLSEPPPGARSEAVASAALSDSREVERVLAECQGNVTRAARTLGVHRNQLRRWLAKRGPRTETDSSD